MTPLNLIFKVISNNKEKQQLVIKFCRQNSPIPIDSYESFALDYLHLDFNTPEKLAASIITCLTYHIEEQIRSEPIPEENSNIETIDSTDLDDYIGKIIAVDYDTLASGFFEQMDQFYL